MQIQKKRGEKETVKDRDTNNDDERRRGVEWLTKNKFAEKYQDKKNEQLHHGMSSELRLESG
jgi:hypothetical protein